MQYRFVICRRFIRFYIRYLHFKSLTGLAADLQNFFVANVWCTLQECISIGMQSNGRRRSIPDGTPRQYHRAQRHLLKVTRANAFLSSVSYGRGDGGYGSNDLIRIRSALQQPLQHIALNYYAFSQGDISLGILEWIFLYREEKKLLTRRDVCLIRSYPRWL